MIRCLHLKNFVRFKEPQTLHFQPGVNLLIGENASGKTSILEGIRRCLSIKKNTTLSRRPEKKVNSYVVSKYYDQEENKGENYTVACILHSPGEGDSDGKYYKAAVTKDSVHVSLIRNSTEKPHYTEVVTIPVEMQAKLRGILTKEDEEIHKSMEEVFKIISNAQLGPVNPNPSCEGTLKGLTDSAVFTFSLRGISPMEWTKSEEFDKEKPMYLEKREKEEIIKYFESHPESKESAQEIFDIITDKCGFRFEIRVGDDGISKRLVVKDHLGKEVNIFAASEGFLSAKQCALLLTCPEFKTVCIEDPDRGMHVQMATRFRDRVFSRMKASGKVIIMTSHNPILLTPWTLPNTYICRREDEKDFNRVISGQSLSTEITYKDLRIVTDEHFTSLFFAKRILFLEGDSDYTFMKALRMKILEGGNHIKRVVDMVQYGDQGDLPMLQEFATSLQIVSMSGETNKERFLKVCGQLHLRCYFLLDKDAVFEKSAEKPKVLKLYSELDSELKQLKLPEQWTRMRDILWTYGIFVWKDGDIEDMVIDLAMPPDEEALDIIEIEEKVVVTEEPGENKTIQQDTKLIQQQVVRERKEKTTTETIIRGNKEKAITPKQFEVLEISKETSQGTAGSKTTTEKKKKRKFDKTDFVKDLESENVTIPFNKWKRSKKARLKLYSKIAKEENVNKSMDVILRNVCEKEKKENEIVLLCKFLLRCASGEFLPPLVGK